MKLEPRKATDRGGWLCMPLVINGPEGNLVGKRYVARNAGHSAGRDRRMQGLLRHRTLTVRYVPSVH